MADDGLYLDIETTYQGDLTLVGFHAASTGTVQLVIPELTAASLQAALPDADAVYTYNGERFDLAILQRQLGVDLTARYRSVDLMGACHRAGIYGGLKGAEERLRIGRKLPGIVGKDAAAMWYQWTKTGDRAHLDKLLAYNAEDVENLVTLRRELERRFNGGRPF